MLNILCLNVQCHFTLSLVGKETVTKRALIL